MPKSYIFYNPDTLEIRGMSTGNLSMDLPYVKIDKVYHDTGGIEIKKVKGKHEVKVKKGTISKVRGKFKKRTKKKK